MGCRGLDRAGSVCFRASSSRHRCPSLKTVCRLADHPQWRRGSRRSQRAAVSEWKSRISVAVATALMTASLLAECRRESTPFTLIRGFDERLLRGGPDRLYVTLHKMQHESRLFIRFQRLVGHLVDRARRLATRSALLPVAKGVDDTDLARESRRRTRESLGVSPPSSESVEWQSLTCERPSGHRLMWRRGRTAQNCAAPPCSVGAMCVIMVRA